MNTVREIQNLNKRELENLVSPEASWHADYRDTAYIYIGGLPFDLSEGDVLTIFSQYGEPTYINLIRDKESGKSKGFAFLKYEDQRSTDLAVDNLGGATVMGRVLKVDHTRYKRKDGEEEEEERERGLRMDVAGKEEEGEEEEKKGERREKIKEEVELEKLMRDHDEDDPMKSWLVQEKLQEVVRARARDKVEGKGERRKKEHRHHHRHHHRHDGHRREHKERRKSDDTDGEGDDGRRSGRGEGHRRAHRRRSRSP